MVTKADLPGAETFRRELAETLGREVLLISAVTGQGLNQLVAAIAKLIAGSRPTLVSRHVNDFLSSPSTWATARIKLGLFRSSEMLAGLARARVHAAALPAACRSSTRRLAEWLRTVDACRAGRPQRRNVGRTDHRGGSPASIGRRPRG